MTDSNAMVRRRKLSTFSLLVLGVLFLTSPLTHFFYRGVADTPGRVAMRGFVAPLSMVLFVGAVLGIAQLLRRRADAAGLSGAVLAIVGWTAGVRILGLGQLESLVRSGTGGVSPDTFQKMFEAAPIVFLSIVPMGILFPIGLVTLGIALLAVRPVPGSFGALLTIGAVLFPVGRIGHVAWAMVWSDVVLGAAFTSIGLWLLGRPELWKEGAEPVEEARLEAPVVLRA